MAAGTIAKFRRDDGGSIGIAFGLMVVGAITIAGLGLDYGRILLARNALITATDAASLAAGRALLDGSLDEAQVKLIGEAYFTENAKDLSKVHAKIPKPVITTDAANATVTVSAQINLPMALMGVAGFKNVTIPAASTVAFDTKDLEVGMALDITGSMDQSPPGGGGRKIDGLKSAFKNFAETLIPATPPLGRKIRVGIAPFSAAINLGKFASSASSNRSADGCVTERGNATHTDKSPGGGGAFLVAADGVANIDGTEGGIGTKRYVCPTASIMPLTDNRADLIKQVNNYKPAGFTGGHFGVQWAWNLVSEDFASFWGGSSAPAPYADAQGVKPKLVKAVIVMSDGIFNTAYHDDKASKQALALCTAMKAKNILVFTIGFGLSNSGSGIAAKQTLKDCATPGTLYFADAANTAELDAALKSFATVLTQLRLAS